MFPTAHHFQMGRRGVQEQRGRNAAAAQKERTIHLGYGRWLRA